MFHDNKQRILIALYVEYQKDISNYNNLTAEIIKMNSEVFKQYISKLNKEELVLECLNEDFSSYYEPTLQGIDYIERLFHIGNSLSNIVKLERIGYELQEAQDDVLVTCVKNAIIEINPCYEEHYKTNKFKNRYDLY